MSVSILDTDIAFFICDDVRHEEGGKMSLIGVSPNNRTTLSGWAARPGQVALSKLCLFFNFTAGEGAGSVKFEIIYPSGRSLLSSDEQTFEKNFGDAATFVIALSPFKVEEVGLYTVNISIEGQVYKRTFQLSSD